MMGRNLASTINERIKGYPWKADSGQEYENMQNLRHESIPKEIILSTHNTQGYKRDNTDLDHSTEVEH